MARRAGVPIAVAARARLIMVDRRHCLGISQIALSRLSDIPAGTIALIESGRRSMSVDAAQRLAPVLNVAHWTFFFEASHERNNDAQNSNITAD